MKISELHKKLTSAYSHDTLHRITTTIIDLYKNKQHESLDAIMNIVAEHTHEKREHQSKAFYKLMMIYHPDRIKHYLAEIEKHFHDGNAEQLHTFAHIFPVLDLEKTLKTSPPVRRPYEPEEPVWDNVVEEFDEADFEDDDVVDDDIFDEFDEPVHGRSFFNAFKRMTYGSTNVELPFYYLEELDTLDMAGYEINSLDGLEHCKNLVALDLSNNAIDDIGEISTLAHLREIYLAGNRIGYIDALGYCPQLKIVDVSYNAIDDISPLLELRELEYVNLVGNDIPQEQIAALLKKNIMVIW